MKTGKTITELAQEIQRQSEEKRDFIADTRELILTDDGRLQVADHGLFSSTRHARRQLGTYTGVPSRYFDKMEAEAPDLLAANVNHWLHAVPKRRMIRTMGENARAFVSDRYQRIDNMNILAAALPILQEVPDLKIASCEVTERKMYIKAVSPRVQGEVRLHDAVQAGVVISNSEIGAGAIRVEPLVYRLVCLNGMILPDRKFSKAHLGKAADESESVYEMLSDETRKADDEVILMKVRDLVKGALDQTIFNDALTAMRDATERRIEGNPVKAVEILTSKFSFTESQGGNIMQHLIEGGDLSHYGLVNAVTRTAQDMESYDDSTEMEAIGGKILSLQPSEYNEILQAA